MTRLSAISRTFQYIIMVPAVLTPMVTPAAPKGTNPATNAPGVFIFTAIGNIPGHTEDVAPVHVLLDTVDARHSAFVVRLGNLEGHDEACSNTSFEACHDLLDSLITPAIYIPGDHGWSDYQYPAAGSFDPAKHLLHLRELFYSDDSTLD